MAGFFNNSPTKIVQGLTLWLGSSCLGNYPLKLWSSDCVFGQIRSLWIPSRRPVARTRMAWRSRRAGGATSRRPPDIEWHACKDRRGVTQTERIGVREPGNNNIRVSEQLKLASVGSSGKRKR